MAEPESGPKGKYSNGLNCSFGIWIAFLGIDLGILLFAAPSFEAMYRDMYRDMSRDLPSITRMLLRASDALRSPPGIAGSALAVLGSIGILVSSIPRSRKVWIFGLLALAAFLIFPVIGIALFLPLDAIIQSVGKPGS